MSNYNEYISKYTSNSELRCRFVSFIESRFKPLALEDEIEVQSNLRNYKLIAEIGFLELGSRPRLKEIFEKGVQWIIGRHIDSSEPMIYDNIAIMGLMVGIKQLSSASREELGQALLSHLEKLREGNVYDEDMIRFWNCWFKKSHNDSLPLDQNLRLLLNRYSQNAKELAFDYIKTYQSIKRDTFPYVDEEDLFMNIIMFNNLEFIEEQYILSYSNLEKTIKESQYQVLKPLLERVDRKSKAFSKIVLGGLATLATALYTLAGYYVWTGDWDFLEPKTFIFLGTPVLGYITLILIYIITEKELTLSPKKLGESIVMWRKGKLMERYGIKIE